MLFGAYRYMWRFACVKVVRTTSHHFAPKIEPELNTVTIRCNALTCLTSNPLRTRMLQAELLNRENRGCCSFFFWPDPRDPNFFARAALAGGRFWGSFLEPDFALRRALFAVGHPSRPLISPFDEQNLALRTPIPVKFARDRVRFWELKMALRSAKTGAY
jgi:hypothetical protein